MLKADGFDKAVIGIGQRCGAKDIIVYDALKCINILVERDGMIFEEAREFFEFNTLGAWVGEETPMFVWNYNIEEINELNQ
jgi:hypothetical protein